MIDLEKRVEELEQQISFLARMMKLKDAGHATPPEYEWLNNLAEKFDRFSESNP